MAEEKLNLYQKLAKIRAIADVVAKDKKGYNYNYADIITILAKVTGGMKKYGVTLIPSVVPGTGNVSQNVIVNTKFDKTGKPYEQTASEMVVTADMVFRWVNEDDPSEFIDVPWFLTGSQGDPSQAFGSGITYCTRYFLTSYFQIAQADTDPDDYRSKQKAAEESENRAVAESIISELDVLVRNYLADNQGKSEDVKQLMSRYAKNGNYKSIREPMLASKLLEDFKTRFINSNN